MTQFMPNHPSTTLPVKNGMQVHLKNLKKSEYMRPNLKKQFEAEIGLANSKLNEILKSPLKMQNNIQKQSSDLNFIGSMKNSNPVNLLRIGQ